MTLVPIVAYEAKQYHGAALQDPLLQSVGDWESGRRVHRPETAGLPEALADGSLLVAMCLGVVLWLLFGSGLASYAFETKREPEVVRRRRLAVSYYAAAPLALLPVLFATLMVAYIIDRAEYGDLVDPATVFGQMVRGITHPITVVVEPRVIGLAVLALLGLVVLWVVAMPALLLMRGWGVGFFHAAGVTLVLAFGWLVLFILLVLGLPALAYYVQIAWHTLRP